MIEEISTARVVQGSRGRPRWWLIAKNGSGRVKFLTTNRDGGEILPVFGHEEEAEMFLHLGGYGDDGWRARESSAGEMVSVLYGPCSGAEGVALDPLPEMTTPMFGTVISLVTLDRQSFIDGHIGREELLGRRLE
jgi:hypothetical protein